MKLKFYVRFEAAAAGMRWRKIKKVCDVSIRARGKL
jgi:hypothetical protein